MGSVTGSGVSTDSDTGAAIAEALAGAGASLAGRDPNIGFVFASSEQDLGVALEKAKAQYPSADFVGCTTAGELTERGLVKSGVSVLLAALDGEVAAVFSEIGDSTTETAAALCVPFGDLKAAASGNGQTASTSILLIDGLAGVGEDLVKQIRTATNPIQQIVGGASGDDGQFASTQVGMNGSTSAKGAAAVHVFGESMWGVGVSHGLSTATDPMEVTRSEANVVYELDGRPAYDVYKEFAAERGVELTEENRGSYMIHHELGILFFDEIKGARAPLAVGEKGEVTCAADVPEGSFVSILDGSRDDLVAAATEAAKEAHANLGGKEAAGILLFDCICRGMILDDEFKREIDAVREVFPGVPVAGFLTYGEIARYKGKLDGWHNSTAVVVAIPK